MNELIKETPQPDRYYTPQIQALNQSTTTVPFEVTPRPESVRIKRKSEVSKNESCCLSCLLACFLCFAVKGEDAKLETTTTAANNPSPTLSEAKS